MAKTTKKRTRQGFLPEMEPPSHKDINEAAEDYVDARDARMRLTKTEVETKGRLLEKMQEHKLTTYATPDGFVVTVDGVLQVKVKRAKPEENGESEE